MAYSGNAGEYVHITGTGTVLAYTGKCVLHSVTVNAPTATETIEIDDALTNTTPIVAKVTIPATPVPVSLIYDVICQTGLSITTATASSDITICYIPL